MRATINPPEDHRSPPDRRATTSAQPGGCAGPQQVTDACLAAPAKENDAMLAIFDKGLAALHPDAVELIA